MATEIGNIVFAISADLKSLQGQLRTMEGSFQSSFGRIEGLARSTLGTLGAGLSVAGLATFGKQIVDTNIALERITNTLKVVAGSSQAAGVEFAFVREQAKRLGTDLETSATQYAQLAAASKGTALQGDETRRIFTAISEAALVLGLSSDQTSGALNAIQQIMSKGTVQAEELRGQLGERLPGAFQIAARAMGVTTQELGKLLEGGKVTAEQLLPKLATELTKTFGPGVANSANSTQAAINRLNTALFEFRATIADAGFITVFSRAVEGLTGIMGGLALAVERVQVLFGGAQERAVKDRIANIDQAVRGLRQSFEDLQKVNRTPTIEAALQANVAQRGKLLDERAQLENKLAPQSSGIANLKVPPAPVAAKGVDKKSADDFKRVADSIQDETDRLQAQIIELQAGKQAADEFLLKQKELRETEKGATAEILKQQEIRRAQIEDIRELTSSYEQLKRAVDATRGQPLEEEITFGRTPEQQAEALRANDEVDRQRDDARKQLQSLRAQLQIAAIDTTTPQGRENKRIAQIQVEFAKTAAELQRVGELAGQTQEEIAENVQLAWKGSLAEITQSAKEADPLVEGILGGIQETFRGVIQGTQSFGQAMKNLWRNIGLSIASEFSKAVNGSLRTVFDELLGSFTKTGGSSGGGSGLFGGLLGSLGGLFNGGGSAGGLFGFGSAPAGVAGPSFANGGFFSSAGGSILSSIGSFFGGFFDNGGVVPGPIGAPRLAVVHGGEVVLNSSQQRAMAGGGTVYNIDARGAQRGVSREIQAAILQAEGRAVTRAIGAVQDRRQRSSNYAKAFK